MNPAAWFVAPSIVAICLSLTAVFIADRQDKHIEDMLTGGDHYAFIKAEITDPKKTDDVALSINTSGAMFNVSFWIAPVTSKYPDDAYYSVDKPRHPRDLNPGGSVINERLPPGEYRVEFTARNGTFVEFLTIKVVDGELTQIIDVRRNNKSIYAYQSK